MFTKSPPGFGLIEILIALFIFSFGILALLKLQWLTIQYSHQTILRAIAINQVNQFLEQLSVPAPILKEADWIKIWQQRNQQLIPASNTQVDFAVNNYHLKLHWQGKPILTPITDCCEIEWRGRL